MSELRINNITDTAGSSGPIIAGVSTVTSTSHMVMPSGPTEMRGGRGRGVSNGSKPSTLTLQMIEIGTTGNAIDFGDMFDGGYGAGAASNSTIGVSAGGYALQKSMGYFIFSSGGGQNDFGDLSANQWLPFGVSNNIRGVFGGAYYAVDYNAPFEVNGFSDFIQFATKGDASNFGVRVPTYASASINSSTRGIYAGGVQRYPGTSGGGSPLYDNQEAVTYMRKIEMATLGEEEHFGELSFSGGYAMGVSSSTRGCIGGRGGNRHSSSQVNTIEFVTISTQGNPTDFGDLTDARGAGASCSSSVRGVFMGGNNPSGSTNIIDFITIATTGNATDFGDLLSVEKWFQGCSDVHGGLGD
jgi:hypothetical protein